MAHWNEERKKQIRELLGSDCNVAFVGLMSNGTSTDEVLDQDNKRLDLILGYNSNRNLYAAWNPYLHYFRLGLYTVSAGKLKTKYSSDGVWVSYSELKDGNSGYEKKLLIQPDFLEEFCKHWREFLEPNPADKGYNAKVLWADRFQIEPVLWEEYERIHKRIVARDKEIVEKVRRDYSFRNRVFASYSHPCCCICRCEIAELLEAAHITAVKAGGDDSTENGILLCRNHHKMYDENMIGINGDELIVFDERVKQMPWYKDFVDNYMSRVITRGE